MLSKIANAKNSVKSHFHNHRAKYAFVAGITTGAVAAREVYVWSQGFAEIVADDQETSTNL